MGDAQVFFSGLHNNVGDTGLLLIPNASSHARNFKNKRFTCKVVKLSVVFLPHTVVIHVGPPLLWMIIRAAVRFSWVLLQCCCLGEEVCNLVLGYQAHQEAAFLLVHSIT